jgi:soluble lytic murein transglycosylase-like protein
VSPHSGVNPKLKIVLLLFAAVVAAFALSALASQASAGSGGFSVGGEGKSGKASANKAKYRRIWNRTRPRDKRWARRTSQCESGRNPKAIGGGGRYRGAFQFMRSTWRRAPKSPGGDPIAYNYKTQAVVAVALKRREGRQHWPHCG